MITEDDDPPWPRCRPWSIARLQPIRGQTSCRDERSRRRACSCRGKIGAAGRIEEIIDVTATIGKPAIIGRAFCGFGRWTVIPTNVGRIPAIGIADRLIPVIAVALSAAQDRRIALVAAYRGGSVLGEAEIACLALGLGAGGDGVVDRLHRDDTFAGTRHAVCRRRCWRQVGIVAPGFRNRLGLIRCAASGKPGGGRAGIEGRDILGTCHVLGLRRHQAKRRMGCATGGGRRRSRCRRAAKRSGAMRSLTDAQ